MMLIRACWFVLLLLLATVPEAHAQVGPRGASPRIWIGGWGGLFTNMGGFSDGPNDFYQFEDDVFAYGGGVGVDTRLGIIVGVEAAYSKPGYIRYDRAQALPVSEGDASVLAVLLNARFAAGGGTIGIYFGGGLGFFYWDVAELGSGWNRDFALNGAVGAEYTLFRRAPFFAEYGQWWVYHEKEGVQTNTAKHNLLRIGIRAGLL